MGDMGFGFPSPSSGSHVPTQVTVLALQGLQAEPGTGIQPLQVFGCANSPLAVHFINTVYSPSPLEHITCKCSVPYV